MKAIKHLKKNSPYVDVREISDLRDMLISSAELWPDNTAIKMKKEKGGVYENIKYSKLCRDSEALGTALMNRGHGKGAAVAILAPTRYEWYVSYLATVGGEAVVVPLDKLLSPSEIERMLKIAGVTAVFYSEAYNSMLHEMAGRLPELKLLIPFDNISDKKDSDCKNEISVDLIHFSELLEEGEKQLASGDKSWRTHEIDPEEMRILLFTSGTTASAKPVMHCHRSICANLENMASMIDITPEDVFLSVLPLHHTYECTCGFLCAIYRGAAIAICEGLRYITQNLKESGCTVFLVVPLMLEAIHRILWKKIRTGGKEKTVRRLINICRAFNHIKIFPNKLIFKSIHEALGEKLRLIICGGAAIDPQILQDFDDFGIVALQGYGLTECAPILALNRIEYRNHAAAGIALRRTEVKIDNPDEYGVGEILGKGANLMLGYYKEPELTAKAMEGGYYHTGDLGYIDDDGFVIIKGRLKNVIIASNGENVFPEELEYELCRSDIVKEAVVSSGENSKGSEEIQAEIFPDYDAIKEANGGDLPAESEILSLIEQVVKNVNETLPIYKKIKNVKLRENAFEKNTSQKIKRKYKVNKQ